jgi:hypothetical protein
MHQTIAPNETDDTNLIATTANDSMNSEFKPHRCTKKISSKCKLHGKTENQQEKTEDLQLPSELVCCNFCPSVEDYMRGVAQKDDKEKSSDNHETSQSDENDEKLSSAVDRKSKRSLTFAIPDCNTECYSHVPIHISEVNQLETGAIQHRPRFKSFEITTSYLELTENYAHGTVSELKDDTYCSEVCDDPSKEQFSEENFQQVQECSINDTLRVKDTTNDKNDIDCQTNCSQSVSIQTAVQQNVESCGHKFDDIDENSTPEA